MATTLFGGFGGGGSGFNAGGLSPMAGRRLQELLYRRQQQEQNEGTQRGYEAIGGRGGEAINTPGALGTKSVGFGQYTQRLNEDTELQDLLRSGSGQAPLGRNPIARSGIPGTSFLQPSPAQGRGVQGGPFSEAGGSRPGESAGQTQLRQAGRLPTAAGRAFGQQPPSGLEQATTAGEMLGVGGAAQQAGYGAGPAMIRRALQALAGVQKPLNMPGQPGLGGLGTQEPTSERLTTESPSYRTAEQGYMGAALRGAQQQRGIAETLEPPVEDPRIRVAEIGAQAERDVAQLTQEGRADEAQQRAIAALGTIFQSGADMGDPAVQQILQGLYGAAGLGGAGGAGLDFGGGGADEVDLPGGGVGTVVQEYPDGTADVRQPDGSVTRMRIQ